MPFAAAFSTHPVSAYATGEVIGQILEGLPSSPDVALLVARPGHAGAMEDIAGAVTSVLDPTVLLGAVVEGVGGPLGVITEGPALALWAAAGGHADLWAPGAPLRPGAVILELSTALGGRAGTVEAAAMRALVGPPLVAGQQVLTHGSAGIAFGPGLLPDISFLSDRVSAGPPLVVTAGSGHRVFTLDGEPAAARLTDVLRDHLPATRLDLASSVTVRLPGGGPTVATVGIEPATSAVVLAPEAVVAAGDVIGLEVSAGGGMSRLADGYLGAADASAALVFVGAGTGGAVTGAELDPDLTPLPDATLICATPGVHSAGPGGVAEDSTTAIALFPTGYGEHI